MRSALFAPLAVLIALGPLTGCGSSSDKELLLTDAAQAFATEVCARAYLCCTTDEMGSLQVDKWTDQASCVTYWTNLFNTLMVQPAQTAIAAQRGQYRPVEAARCLDSFTQRGCAGAPQNDFAALAVVCDAMYDGLQAVGQPCRSFQECASGLLCIGATGTTEGTCQAYLALDAACTPNSSPPCAAELYCDGAACKPRKAATVACAATSECQVGLECDATEQVCKSVPLDTCDGQ
jgi:hypothetical protein